MLITVMRKAVITSIYGGDRSAAASRFIRPQTIMLSYPVKPSHHWGISNDVHFTCVAVETAREDAGKKGSTISRGLVTRGRIDATMA